MNLAQYSLDNTKIVYFFLAVLLIGGILSFGRLGKKEDAPFVIKSAVIMTRYPGAEPAEVERLVTEPISREIQSVSYTHLRMQAYPFLWCGSPPGDYQKSPERLPGCHEEV